MMTPEEFNTYAKGMWVKVKTRHPRRRITLGNVIDTLKAEGLREGLWDGLIEKFEEFPNIETDDELNYTDTSVPEEEWHAVPPARAGTYEYCCGETNYEAEFAEVFELGDGSLHAEIDGITQPIEDWHENLTSVAWR